MKGDIAQKRVGYLRRVDYLYMALSIHSNSGWLTHLTSTGSISSLQAVCREELLMNGSTGVFCKSQELQLVTGHMADIEERRG
jgi:hypothetical protein